MMGIVTALPSHPESLLCTGHHWSMLPTLSHLNSGLGSGLPLSCGINEETEAQRRHPGQNLNSHSLPPEPKAPEQLLSEAPPKCPGPRAMEGSEHLLDMNLFNPHGDLLPSLHI